MVEFIPIEGADYKHDYEAIFADVADGKIEDPVATYRDLCRNDLFFLLYFGVERTDVNRAWLVDRIREVEENHKDTLDLWAREHYKSTIITYGLVLQKIVQDPERRVGIFSHTRPIAKGFLRQIKITLEEDCPLKTWFADIFYDKPKAQAPKWSEDDGLVVKRKTKPKESTIEAWGLVDGQPTSKHFTDRVYDDVVTEDGVGNVEQISKAQKAYEISQSLGTDGGTKLLCGTCYHFADLYAHLRKKDIYKVRVYPATHDGTPTGEPVLISKERLEELRREQGSYVFSCQQLLNPVAPEDQKFKPAWLRYYDRLPPILNRYILCDPANEKRKKSDFTALGAIGVDPFDNYYLLDLVRDKLNPRERWEALRDMWQDQSEHGPVLRVGYEKYGKDSDIFYFEEQQKIEGIYFTITPLAGLTGKPDRIMRLVPLFETGRFYLPRRLYRRLKGEDKEVDIIKLFVDEEYEIYPFSLHDDIFDMISRIRDADMMVKKPAPRSTADSRGRRPQQFRNRSNAWMAQ